LQGSLLTDIGAAINRYFAWMASGPRWRFGVGIGGPILVLVIFYQLVNGGGSEPLEVVTSSPTSSAGQAVVVEQASTTPSSNTTRPAGSTTPGTAVAATQTPKVSTTPQATIAPGGTYTVKSGDTLGAICSANVPSMSINACVDAIVQLNGLTSAASLQIDQHLTLPGGTPGAAGTPPAATPTVSQPASTATQAAIATATPFDPASFLGSTDPPANFCSMANCIPSFSDGQGYVVQCGDGLYSKSGGRTGACAGHGDVAR
jgi:LysM repeat protein